MSPKELLYIEDALSHMKFMKERCNNVSSQVQDPNLKALITRVGKKQDETFKQIYKLLEG